MLQSCVSCPVSSCCIQINSCILCEILHKRCTVSLLSGLVDAHTHPVWAGDRVHEFAMKVTYYLVFSLQLELNK